MTSPERAEELERLRSWVHDERKLLRARRERAMAGDWLYEEWRRDDRRRSKQIERVAAMIDKRLSGGGGEEQKEEGEKVQR